MGRVARAALAYFAAVFAAGFVLGIAREFVVRPRLGPLAAIVVEAPAMLLVCWACARWMVRRFGVATRGELVRMGTLAFALLMVAELGGSIGLRRMGAAEWIAQFATPAGAISLGLFVVFAAMPLVVRR
jgi:hypothetical protein